MSKNDQRAVAAEFQATMYFVFMGCGSVVAAAGYFKGGGTSQALVAIAIAHGIGILIAVAWTANLSGGHINPARSFGPALAVNEWKDFWIDVVGPAAGGVIVALFWTSWRNFGEERLDEATA